MRLLKRPAGSFILMVTRHKRSHIRDELGVCKPQYGTVDHNITHTGHSQNFFGHFRSRAGTAELYSTSKPVLIYILAYCRRREGYV